jgi:hypothetical protein
MQRENLEAFFLDLHLADIDLDLTRRNFRSEIASPLDQRLTSFSDHLLNPRRLVKDFALQQLKISL